MSEYQLLRAAVGTGAWLTLVAFLAASGVVFVSALRHLIDMAFGAASDHDSGSSDATLAVPIVALGAGLLLVLGVWMPLPLSELIASAVSVLGDRP